MTNVTVSVWPVKCQLEVMNSDELKHDQPVGQDATPLVRLLH